MNLKIYNTEKEQIENIIMHFVDSVNTILQRKTHAVIAFSGGKSPINLLQTLSNVNIAWNRIIVTLVDERITDTSSLDSNEHLIKKNLLINYAAKAKFIGLVDLQLKIDDMLVKASIDIPNIDIAFLGMGEDGHTASIFADSKELSDAINLHNTKRYININPITAKYSRISLTLSAIRTIEKIFLCISGDLKLKVLRAALETPSSIYPISYLLKERKDIDIFWYNH